MKSGGDKEWGRERERESLCSFLECLHLYVQMRISEYINAYSFLLSLSDQEHGLWRCVQLLKPTVIKELMAIKLTVKKKGKKDWWSSETREAVLLCYITHKRRDRLLTFPRALMLSEFHSFGRNFNEVCWCNFSYITDASLKKWIHKDSYVVTKDDGEFYNSTPFLNQFKFDFIRFQINKIMTWAFDWTIPCNVHYILKFMLVS